MATGWAGDGAVQDQIDATVKDAIKRARSQLKQETLDELMLAMDVVDTLRHRQDLATRELGTDAKEAQLID